MSNLATQATALSGALKAARPESMDDGARVALSALQDELAIFLASASVPKQDHESAIEHLERIALRFEAEHPTVGAAVREAINTLVKAGV